MATVLLVEDEKVILEEVSTWLQFEGYDVLKATNGQEGLDLAIKHKPDVIVCDVRMPIMNGRDMLIAIRNNGPLKQIPFIFATASAETGSVTASLEMGANAHLTKPFEFDELLSAIATCIEAAN